MELAQSRIKKIFEALGTTANAFAITHGFNVTTVYGFVNGSRSPGFETLVNLCQAEPRISAEYLLRGEGDPLRDQRLIVSMTTLERLKELKDEVIKSFDKRIEELGG